MATATPIHPSLVNLAPKLAEAGVNLDDIGAEIISLAATDREERSGWEEMHANWLEMYRQTDKTEGRTSWDGSQESIPVLAEACTQYHTRAYEALFGHRQLVKGIPTGRPDVAARQRGERIGLHMTWQITVESKRYLREKDALLLNLPLHGSAFTKTYYDPALQQNQVINVRAVDLLTPFGIGPSLIEDLERKTELVWTTYNKTALMAKNGWLTEPGTPFRNPLDQMSLPDLAEMRAEKRSGPQDKDDMNYPVLLLECHTIWDLDGDGIAEPYIITVDAESQKVLRIVPRWEMDEAGNPVGAKWYDDKKPVEYYTHYTFFENPNGFLGLGLGHLLGEPNKAVNKLLRQIIDAGTLSTVGNMSGFINQAIGGPHGEVELELGHFLKVGAGVDDLRKAIYKFDFPGPNAALFQALQLIMQRADRLGTITEAVSGQTDKVIQPTALLALLEESGRMFSSVQKRVITAWNDELAKLYRLNRMHLDPRIYFSILDAAGNQQDMQVAREDYTDDMQVQPIADPNQKSDRERMQRAEIEWQFLAQNPLVQQSPIHWYNASKRFMESIRAENIASVLPNPADMNTSQIMALMAAMVGMNKDATGLNEQPPGGPQGLGGGSSNANGAAGIGGNLPSGGMEDGGDVGGAAPGTGATGSGGLPPGPM